jgi:hypothetical protein
MKSCTLHDNDGRLTATVDNKAFVVFGGEIHDLAELGSGDVGVDAAVHGYTIRGHELIN